MNYNKLNIDNSKTYIIQNLNTDIFISIKDEDVIPTNEEGFLLKRGDTIKLEQDKFAFVRNVRFENQISLEYSEYNGFIWGLTIS